MNVALTPDLRAYVARRMQAGRYTSAGDVIREALESLRMNETMTPADVADLRREASKGLRQLERGETADFTAKDTQMAGRRILAARKDQQYPPRK